MPRTPREVIQAILANLSMARDVAKAKIVGAGSHCNELLQAREAYAYQQAIDLINTEAREILGDCVIRHLSDGTAVEMVRPWSDENPRPR